MPSNALISSLDGSFSKFVHHYFLSRALAAKQRQSVTANYSDSQGVCLRLRWRSDISTQVRQQLSL